MFKKTIVSGVLLASSSAYAVPQDLTFDVMANIPSSIMSLTPNGGWTSITMSYDINNRQLNAATRMLDIRTDGSRDLEAWLQSVGEVRNGSGDAIAVMVSINGATMGVGQADKELVYAKPSTPGAVADIIPVTVTPAPGPHPAGSYNGQMTVVYDVGF